MRMFGSCGKSCVEQTFAMTVCDLPAIDRLRKVGEADDYTMFELSKIDEGIILNIDYISEEEGDANG